MEARGAATPRSIEAHPRTPIGPEGTYGRPGDSAPGPWHPNSSYPAGPALPGIPPSGSVATGIGASTTSTLQFNRDEHWVRLIVHACGPVRGPAVKALADYLATTTPERRLDTYTAMWLSLELLQHEPASTCETLTVLLQQDWEGTLGELLAASRAL